MGVPRSRFSMPHLDFVRLERHQPVEAATEACHVLARQTDDEIHMQMRRRVLHQPGDVFFRPGIVLAPADVRLHLRIEGLYADLELQDTRRKAQDGVFQRMRQVIRNHLEMHE